MKINVDSFRFHMHWIRTRFPFRYGITSMTEVPYLFVTSKVSIDGVYQQGISADGLPPKWFTKDPNTTFEEDVAEMIRVIRNAADLACLPKNQSFFDWWNQTYFGQLDWANQQGLAPTDNKFLPNSLDSGLSASYPFFSISSRARLNGTPLR